MNRMNSERCLYLCFLISFLSGFESVEGSNVTEMFNRDYTGVAYFDLSHAGGQTGLARTPNSLKEVETMLKMISRRFSKVTTLSVGAGIDSNYLYEVNVTYNENSFPDVFVAEAAANINKETRASRTPLKVYIGIWVQPSDEGLLNLEVNVANEAIKKANHIYDRTVEGVVFGYDAKHADKSIPMVAEKLKTFNSSEAKTMGVKVGSRHNWDQLQKFLDNTTLMREIIETSDFLICEIIPKNTTATGALSEFKNPVEFLLSFRLKLNALNPQFEIMFQTGLASNLSSQEELIAMRDYWLDVDKFAAEKGFTVWMLEAFDNPRKPGRDAHFGWWKFTNESTPQEVTALIKKVGASVSGSYRFEAAVEIFVIALIGALCLV